MKQNHTTTFVVMAILFNVCLIASNLFAVKLFCLFGKFTLSGAVIIFPISYILNDCLSEVYGYRKAQLVIWSGFAMNFFFVLVSQLVILLPGAPFWEGDEAFRYVFGAAPRATAASLLAFLAGSTINALVMSRMKVADKGKRFGLRAVVSSIAGETIDSLIFVPIVFWNMGSKVILITMACQIVAKVCYEIIVLPLTARIVKRVKAYDGIDTYDNGISYNPFKLKEKND
ncbi:MAG: queuosine precursor transporter [Bacteroidaceae bacterium]|nr:queuosine precursor transporter [Bacteroidaceae bacterium]